LVLALTLLLFPTVGKNIGAYSLTGWPIMVFTEFLVGVGMGLATNIVFEATALAGQVLGVQMGYSLVNILDPQTQVDTTVVPLFYQTMVMLLFLRMDVLYWLLKAVGNSFLYLPPGTTHLSGLFTQSVITTGGQMFGLGVQIAAPVLVGNAGHGHSSWAARQGFGDDAAHRAWAGNQEPSGNRNSDCNTEVLARSVPSLV
jgi:flagellar biosynthetic protein FliR